MSEEDYAGMTPEDYAAMAGVTLDGTPLPSTPTDPESVAWAAMPEEAMAEMATYYERQELTAAFGEAALSSPEALFAHLTRAPEDERIWVGQAGNWTEGTLTELSVFADDLDFQRNLHTAIQRPGFLDFVRGDGHSNISLEALLTTTDGQNVARDMIARIAADDFDGDYAALTTEFTSRITVAAIGDLRESLRGMDASERFAAIETALTSNDEIPEEQRESAEAVFAALRQEGEVFDGLREAVGNAFAYNDSFAAFVVQRMGDGEGGSELTALLRNLNPTTAGPLTGILNNLASHPEMSTDNLETVIETVSTHRELMQQRADLADNAENAAERARLLDEIEAAETAMYAAIREAGGVLPAMTEMSGPIMMAFMMDLVNGTGTDGAIANLGAALHLTPEQLEAMQELIGPFAGLIEFMVEPYAQLYQEHGVAIMDAFGRTQDRIEILTGAAQPDFDRNTAEAAREADAVFEAPADTGNVVDFNERFTEAAEGADLTNVEVLLETLVEADPELADEVAAIRTDADLMGQFTTWSGMMTDAEVAAASATELYANFNRDIDVRTAVNSTPGLN